MKMKGLVELLEEVLGDHGLHYPNRGQISFNWSVCDDDSNRSNLEVNYIDNVYKCWSCSESEGTHGPLGRIFDKYGNKKAKHTKYSSPKLLLKENEKKKDLKLPSSFTPYSRISVVYPVRRQSMELS